MSKLAARLRKVKVKPKPQRREPVWAGPEGEGPKGGVTQSLLSRWLCCRERFRLKVVDGLAPTDTFNHRMEYGQMWHTCEETLAAISSPTYKKAQLEPLRSYCQNLCKRYPLQQEQVQHWYNVCKAQFPIYVDYWRKHPDVKNRTPLLQEQVFDVPYHLPSGRTVRLRGKWDSVDLIGKGRTAGVYLQENKTKGDIIEEKLKRQLGFDLQTMIYLVALGEFLSHKNYTWSRNKLSNAGLNWSIHCKDPVCLNTLHHAQGIRYNVARRPLAGGKGSIRKHKPTKSNPGGETDEEFYFRLAEIIMEDPGYYFMRWRVEITKQDIDRFKHEFLDNALEQLCDWWHWIDSPAGRRDPFADPVHFRLPYGIYNPLLEGGSSEVDEYLSSHSELGLTRNNQLFRELT